MMDAQKAEEMLQVLKVLRRQRAKALRGVEVAGEERFVATTGGAQISTWLHRAGGTESRPVLFMLHGGGFALGDARRTDALGEKIRDEYGIHVVDISYRLAPEDPWPAALEDVVATLDAYAADAEALHMDPQAFYLMGFSAGANLSVTAALKSQESEHAFALAGIILHYPFLDAATPASEKVIRDGGLSSEMTEAYNAWYLGDNDPADPLVSPVLASDAQLAALPPIHSYPVVGDGCFNECVRFHERLEAVGAPATMTIVEGAYHGYAEDAANIPFYEATTFPEARAARPANYAEIAERVMRQALDSFFVRD